MNDMNFDENMDQNNNDEEYFVLEDPDEEDLNFPPSDSLYNNVIKFILFFQK